MEQYPQESREEPGLTSLLRTLRRRLPVVLIAVILVPAVAAAYVLSKDEEYSATASLLFRSTPGSDFRLSSSDDEEREAATNVSLASLDQVAERTAVALGGGITAGTVGGAVEVTGEGTANLLGVEATTTEPALARRIANEYAEQFVAFRRDADRATVRQAQRRTESRVRSVTQRLDRLDADAAAASGGEAARLNGETAALRAEQARLVRETQQLGALATLSSGNVEVAQRAQTPGSPSSASPSRTLALGLGLGLLLGIGLALLIDLLDRRLRDPSEIESVYGRPTLGAIPLSSALERDGRKGKRRRGARDLGVGEMEAFHMLRANLRYFEVDRPIRSVVVTSAAPGEGKSTVAWNLAAAGANAGSRTLLIEAELRRPTFVREFKLDEGLGLSEVLGGQASPWDVLRRFPGEPGSNGTASATMDVMVAGAIPPNPTDLLDSRRMQQLIGEAEEAYDLVVIDTPPVAVVSDAIPLLKRATGVIVVTRLGSTSRDAANHLRKQLDALNAHVLGVVVNGVGSADGYYGMAAEYAGRYESAEQPSPR